MAWVSINDYAQGKVLLVEYKDTIKNVEEDVVRQYVTSSNYEWMCMNSLLIETIPLEK